MYIENAYLGKSPKLLYLILPFFLLIMLFFTILSAFVINVEEVFKGQIAQKGELLFLFENLIPFLLFFVLLLLWVRLVHQQPLIAFLTTRKKIDWKRFGFAFFGWGIVTILFVLIDFLINPSSYVFDFQLVPFLFLFLISVLLIPFQAGFEELFFRGYLLQGIGILTKSRWFSLLFSSVVFGLMHITNPEIQKLGYGLLFYYVFMGFFFGGITLLDDGMELALGFHTANNLFTALLVTSGWSVFQTPSLLRDISEPTLLKNLVGSFVVLLLFFLVLLKKYQWKNWREKLFGKVKTEAEITTNLKNF